MTRLQTLGLTVAAFALLAPLAAQAQYTDSTYTNTTRPGWYLDGAGMATFQTDAESKVSGVTNHIDNNTGWGVLGGGGYAWGNGVRTEGEIAYRNSSIDKVKGTGSGPDFGGHIGNLSFMGNALYDFNTGTIFTPYVGVGVGTSVVDAHNIHTVNFRDLNSERVKFAYQAIAGVSAALDHNWSLTADYRYFATTNPNFKTDAGDRADTENASHNIVLGVRYQFDEEHPAPAPIPAPMPRPMQAMPAPVPAPAPMAQPMVPAVPQSYMVFFDFDRSTLTPEAKRIIASAAQDMKSGRYVRVLVTGHTDTMGTARYNQKLSERRAASVKAEFVRLGVSGDEISTVGSGKSGLLVPTNDHVREAQNRRAEIVLSKQQ